MIASRRQSSACTKLACSASRAIPFNCDCNCSLVEVRARLPNCALIAANSGWPLAQAPLCQHD